MPPEQAQGLLDLFNRFANFRAHRFLSIHQL